MSGKKLKQVSFTWLFIKLLWMWRSKENIYSNLVYVFDVCNSFRKVYFICKVDGNNIERTLQFLSTDKVLSMEELPSYIDNALSNNAGKEKDLSRSENILLFILSYYL